MLREDWSQRVDLASVLNATQHSMHRYDSNQMQLFTMWELCIRNWQTFVKVLLNLKLRPCFAFRDCICHYSVSTYLTHRFEMEMRCCTVMCCAVRCCDLANYQIWIRFGSIKREKKINIINSYCWQTNERKRRFHMVFGALGKTAINSMHCRNILEKIKVQKRVFRTLLLQRIFIQTNLGRRKKGSQLV